MTVGRAPGIAPAEELTSSPAGHASTQRVVLGTVAAVVCLLVVAGSLLLFSGGDDTEEPTSSGAPTSQLLDFRPPAPQNVTVAPAAADGEVVVAWQAVGDGSQPVHYQVSPETAGVQPINTDQLSTTFTVPAGTRPCFRVYAITDDGRISTPSPLACL